MSFKNKLTLKNILGAGFVLAAVYCLIRSVTLSFSSDIWYDELFSMEFSSYNVKELTGLTARDVHPPLYYIIVRVFRLMGEGLGILGSGSHQISAEMLSKMVSIIPFGLLLIYALTTVRKHFGMLAAGIFSFAIITMPQMPEYTTEIRMYSWAMFFVTAMLLHGFSLYRRFMADRNTRSCIPDAIAIFIYSSAAAYTHYYAALSVGIIFMLLFVLMLKELITSGRKAEVQIADGQASRPQTAGKQTPSAGIKNTANFWLLVASMILTGISYLPWASVVLSQVGAVKNNYWIQPVGLRSFGSAIKHLFKGYFVNDVVAVAMAVLLFAISAVLAVRSFYRAIVKKEERSAYEITSFLVLPILVTVGIVTSMLLRPVFVNRYMIPSYGAFWLSLAMMADRECDSIGEKSGISFPALTALAFAIVVAVVGAVDYRAFVGNEEYRTVNMEKTLTLFEGIPSDTIIISNFDQVQGLLSYYLNKSDDEYSVHLYGAEPEPLVKEMVPGLETIEDPIDIANYLDAGKTVLFLGSFNSREVILGEWNEAFGITYENEGSYLMERYWFDVFRLKRH
jgi:hypothetical protein